MWYMRSLITFTTRKFPLIHMVMLLSPPGRITGCIHGIHKHEMFECLSCLGHCQGKVVWIQEGHQGQDSCQSRRTLGYKGQSCCWSTLSPSTGNFHPVGCFTAWKGFQTLSAWRGWFESSSLWSQLCFSLEYDTAVRTARLWTCSRLPHAVRPHTYGRSTLLRTDYLFLLPMAHEG